MKNTLLIILIACCFSFVCEAKGGVSSIEPSIGGITVGTQGSSGIYSGYTLSGGDSFDGLISSYVFHKDAPFGRYVTTHNYYAGARSVSGLLQHGYDIDPFHTGSQDIKRGVAVGTSDTLNESNGISIKCRVANEAETPYINSRSLVCGMLASVPFLTFTPPAIIEASISFTPAASNPAGWHPTFWVQSAHPTNTNACSGSPGCQEFDITEGTSQKGYANYNAHGSVPGGVGSIGGSSLTSTYPSGYHLYSLVMTTTNAMLYLDGVLNQTFTVNTTASGKAYQILFTGHTYEGGYQGEAFSGSAWTSAGNTGATMAVAYYRIWTPSNSSVPILKPTQKLPIISAAFNTSLSYTIPSLATLWGGSVTDYCQAARFEDFEPGSTGEGTTNYYRFPAELTWDNSARVLSGSVTSRPGRLHIMCSPTLSGSVGYTARGYIDVGPTVNTATISYSNATASYDVYPIADAGTLVPKVVTVTGLPSGLSFSNATGLITGTAETGDYTITVGVTNYVGQSTFRSVTLTVGA